MAKKEILNMNDLENILSKDLAKRRMKVMDEFIVSRHEFSLWYVATVSPVVEWTNPITAWMFAAWVNGSGVKEWVSEEEIAQREAKQATINARKVEREAKQAEVIKQLAKEAEEAKGKGKAIKKDRLVING